MESLGNNYGSAPAFINLTPRELQPSSEGGIWPNPNGLPAPITITQDQVSILGVPLQKGVGGTRVPDWSRFKGDILTDYDIRLMQKIAIAIDLNQALLIEGGSGIGKSQSVERVCALSQKACYYANCQDFTSDVLIGSMSVVENSPTGFGWIDGLVVQAIRTGGVLFLDEYNFMRGDTRGRLHEILDAVLRGKHEIILVENSGEVVPVHPDFRIIAAQNPPGGNFFDREILDAAQLTRFHYLKEPNDLPEEVKQARAYGVFGLRPESTLKAAEWLSATRAIDLEHLPLNADQKKTLAKVFIDAHTRVENAINKGIVASDQPQPLYLSLDRDRKRIFAFMLRYFDGNALSSLHRALGHYYTGMFESTLDKERIENLLSSAFQLGSR